MILQKDRIMFQNNWEILVQNGFNKIFTYMKTENNTTPYQIQKKEVLKQYDLVYQICMSKNSEVRKLCEVNLESQLRKYLSSLLEESGNKIDLKKFISKWIAYSRVLYDWLKKAFKYYDKMKKMINRGSSLEENVFNIFKEEIYEKIKNDLYSEFESIVNEYRANKQIDINACKEYINFLKLFKEDALIEKFITSTEKYFNDLVQTHINSTFNDFMNFFFVEIDKEKKFLSLVFPEEQTVALSRINEVVYFKNFGKLLSSQDGFIYMLNNYDNKTKEKLKYTFDIFINNGNSFSMMSKLFKDFIKNNFKEKIIIKENLDNNPQILKPKDVLFKTNFIESYLLFQRNILDIINYCFANNNIMNLNFKEGLADIQGSLDNANLAYVLPYFFDDVLTKNMSNDERKKQINIGLEIFNCVPDKDVFIDIYCNLMANRILSLFNKNNTSEQINYFNLDLETNIIQIFEKECGNELVQKLNNIILDYNLNETEISEKFVSFMNEQKEVNISSGASLTTKANLVTSTDGIYNSGDLNLYSGTLASDISGNGTTNIKDNVTSDKSIAQTTLTTDATKILTNTGSVTVSTLSNAGTIQNERTLNVSGTTNLGLITDNTTTRTGTLNTTGTVTADGLVEQNVLNIKNGSLTSNASNLDITNGISNAATLILTGGTLTSNVGNYDRTVGITVIDANASTVVVNSTISGNNVELSSGTLKLDSGEFNNIAGLKALGGSFSTQNETPTRTVSPLMSKHPFKSRKAAHLQLSQSR